MNRMNKMATELTTYELVENKAVQALVAGHEVQLVNYLTATGLDEGLLLNFGATRLEFKKKYRLHQPTAKPAS